MVFSSGVNSNQSACCQSWESSGHCKVVHYSVLSAFAHRTLRIDLTVTLWPRPSPQHRVESKIAPKGDTRDLQLHSFTHSLAEPVWIFIRSASSRRDCHLATDRLRDGYHRATASHPSRLIIQHRAVTKDSTSHLLRSGRKAQQSVCHCAFSLCIVRPTILNPLRIPILSRLHCAPRSDDAFLRHDRHNDQARGRGSERWVSISLCGVPLNSTALAAQPHPPD